MGVAVPADTAIQKKGVIGERMLGALLRGVYTRDYASVIPEMAAAVGVMKSVSLEKCQPDPSQSI